MVWHALICSARLALGEGVGVINLVVTMNGCCIAYVCIELQRKRREQAYQGEALRGGGGEVKVLAWRDATQTCILFNEVVWCAEIYMTHSTCK